MSTRARAKLSPARPSSAAEERRVREATPLEKACRRVLVPILLLLYFAQAASSIATKSATWDEVNYVGMGDYLLKHRQWDVPSAVIHPPLAYYLDSLPLLSADFDRRPWTYSASVPRDLAFLGAADIKRGQILLSSLGDKADGLLFRCRLMVMLQGLLLGFFVYRLGSELYGWKAGILALVFFAFCPNMIAHGGVITPDMTLTAFSFIAIYYFRNALVRGDWKSHVLAGIALGLALLSKFPAVLLLPVEVVIAAFAVCRGPQVRVKRLMASWGCALLVLLLGYGFDLTPYFQGIRVQQVFGPEGHWAFLMGQLSKDGWWYYCLVAFVLKTPIPLLLAVAAALVLLGARAIRRAISIDDLVLWIPVVAVFAFFSVELRSIGLRYVLPVYPFLFVSAGAAVQQGLNVRRLKYLLLLPVAWYIAGTSMIFPDYFAYFNELVGGVDNGYKYLVDSNLDWGQDLKGLKRFMDSRGIDRIYLSYFGTDVPKRFGIRYDWLPSYLLDNPNPQTTIDIKRKRYLAISVTNLQGVYMEPHTMFRWLDRYTPIARIGHSIFVYYLD